MSSGPVVAIALEGKDAIEVVRKLMGKTHFVCAPSCKELEATIGTR
jgi:nucleoside diphosphate kinase